MDKREPTPTEWDAKPDPPAPITQPPADGAAPPSTQAESGEAAALVIRYGGFWRRAGANFLDVFAFALASVPSTLLTLFAPRSAASTIVSVATGLLALVVIPYCWARWGMTPGKALMGLRVVRLEDLQPISRWRAVGRFFALYPAILFLGLGIFWIGWNRRKRGWHDRLADTVVIRVPSLREKQDPRRKWAIGAVLAGVPAYGLSILVSISLAVSMFSAGFRDANGAIAFPQAIGIFALRPGDCFVSVVGNSSVLATPCAEEHTFEVFGIARVDAGTYPSEELMSNFAAERCVALFAQYIGEPFDTSAYSASYVGPDRQQWESGARTLICYLYGSDQHPVRGSARGSGD